MRVGIGPRNTSGQAWMLARVLRDHGIDAESFGPEQHTPPMGWPIDRRTSSKPWTEPGWDEYLAGFTHLIAWNGFGLRGGWFDSFRDPRVALMFRGSDLRLPTYHRRLEPWSPFGHKAPLITRLEIRADLMRQRLARWQGPIFVATAEMIDYEPRAVWCPIIADPAKGRPLFTGRKPVVLHNPTNEMMKGSVPTDPAYELVQPGRVSAQRMLDLIADADVVVGGLRLGDYGGTEIQAMAAGRVVVGNIGNRVRSRIPAAVPIVQADPSNVLDVLRDIAANPVNYRAIAARGQEFHRQFHDGRYSVAALSTFLGTQAVAA